MFSSSNKRAYQKIDDDYEDDVIASNSCTSRLLNGMNSTRSALFGSAGEQQSLMNSSSNQHSYHDSPIHNQPETTYEPFTIQGPPTMASSAQIGSRRWDHIENLDEFFTHIYEYHQNGGYLCILLQKIFSLLQFIFIMTFTTFFTQCVDYNFLFANSNVTTHGTTNIGKRHFGDAIIENCTSHLSIWMILAILAALVYWITRIIKHTNYIIKMNEIQDFYHHELKITDDQLPNLTWHAIVNRICEAQKKLRLSIHTDNITSIYIYHRILRYRNFMIAMINKRILHPVYHIPLIGPIAYLPNNLKHEIERILFSSSTAPWNGPNLRDDYKSHEMLDIMAKKLKDDCKFYGLVSLVLMPLLLPFQIMESFFSLTDLIKRRPDGLGLRRYSNYGRYLVRHFNELDHELNARLNRSHFFASAYMEQFFSPVLEIISKNITFIAAAIASVLAALSAWDEDVLQVEHVLTVMTVCGVIIMICRGMIPDENLVWQPEFLMTRVASELHYLPAEWKGKAHTVEVRHEFDQLFQMKWMFFVLELTSPIFTPFILLFWLRPRCQELVNFFHDYTEKVDGLGDVCSFAIMDVEKHGDPNWNDIRNINGEPMGSQGIKIVTSHNRALDGKTELSTLHFKTTNPEWNPPEGTKRFLKKFRNRLGQEASGLAPISMNLGTLGKMPENIQENHPNLLLESIHSILPATAINGRNTIPGKHPMIGDGLHRIDGPMESLLSIPSSRPKGVLASLYQEQPKAAESLNNSLKASGVDIDGAGAEMRLNALVLRGLHDENRIMQSRNYGGVSMMPTQSVFAMPEGFGRKDDSLIDIEGNSGQGPSTSAIGDLRIRIEDDAHEVSRLIMRNESERVEEEDEEEDDEHDAPPLNFSS